MSLIRFASAHITYAFRGAPHPRSPAWARVRREFLQDFPKCSACGGAAHVEAHHIQPFHLRPDLELVRANLIPLCLAKGQLCHLTIGHGDDFRLWNPNVVQDSEDAWHAHRTFDSAGIRDIASRAKDAADALARANGLGR